VSKLKIKLPKSVQVRSCGECDSGGILRVRNGRVGVGNFTRRNAVPRSVANMVRLRTWPGHNQNKIRQIPYSLLLILSLWIVCVKEWCDVMWWRCRCSRTCCYRRTRRGRPWRGRWRRWTRVGRAMHSACKWT